MRFHLIRRTAAVLLFILGGALSAVPAHADERSESLFRDFVAWVASAPDWSASVSIVRSAGRDTLAEGLVFSRADPDVSISVETLRIRDLHEWEGGFAATGIWAGDAAIVARNFKYAIPSAKVEAVTMPGMQGLAFDPRHIMTFIAQAYSAMAEARFSNLSVPEIEVSSQQTSAETGETVSAEIAYGNLAIAGVSDGIVGRTTVGPISIKISAAGSDFDFTVQSASSDRTDLGALAHIFDPAEYRSGRGDRSWRPILSRIDYSGISGSGPDGLAFKLDEIAVENLDGRQLDKPFTRIWDQLLDLTISEESKADLALDLIRTYAAWRLGAFRLTGLSIDVPAESASFSLEDLTMSGISSNGADSLVLNGMSGHGAGAFVELGSLELSGFVSPNLEALIAFAALENGVDPKMHAETIAKSFAALPRFSHLALHDAVGGKSESEAVSLESLTLDFRDWNDVFAGVTDMRATGLKIPPQLLGPELADLIGRLNYDDLVFGLSLSDRWAPEAGTDDAVWTITLRDGGDLRLSYALTGLTLDWLVKATAAAAGSEDSGEAVQAMLDELRLRRATLSVTDRSVLERAFGFAAEAQELDVDGRTYMKQMRAAFPFLISAALPPALSKLLSKPMQGFLAGGQMLVAEIMPAEPLNISEFFAATDDPLALPEVLNLKLRSEAPAQ